MLSHLAAVSAYAPVPFPQVNLAAAAAGIMSPQPALFPPPGNSLSECVNFALSKDFKKIINVNSSTPPMTIVGDINQYLSACVCKVYNGTMDASKSKFSSTLLIQA